MGTYFAQSALLPTGWAKNVLITADDAGWITQVVPETADKGSAPLLAGPVLPGMPNVHSHAFQRAMAGLTERRSEHGDSFWTWREAMYRFLDKIGPDDMGAIAAQLYVEMLKGGYTSVGEFHYVHHQPDGMPYADRAELSRRVIRAAQSAGVGITHMPVLYAYGGFGGAAPSSGQRRFIHSVDGIMDIFSSLQNEFGGDVGVRFGLALHSLRAVSPEMAQEIFCAARRMDPEIPVHIHVAEQTREVEDCLSWSGKRPVEWLLENMPVDAGWCLVHATHMTAAEIACLIKTGAVVGLCPTTEANLGDGLFPLQSFLEKEGKVGVGSDSHVSVNAFEELRLLEYGQRLVHCARVIGATATSPSVGSTLYGKALEGGRQALGRAIGRIERGARADFIVLDAENPALLFKEKNDILDAAIFACATNPVRDVFVGGKQMVRHFRHIQEETILQKYKETIARLSGH